MKLISALFFLIICSNVTWSQNKIYLHDEVRDGKVIEITPGEIKYTNPSYPTKVNSVARINILLLFNDKGMFLVVTAPGSSAVFLSNNVIDNFINYRNYTPINIDRIFTKNKKIINCTIINEDILSLFINLDGTQLKVDKDTVAVVIYKNGEHTLTTNIETATNVLYSFQLQSEVNSRQETSVQQTQPLVNTEQAINDSSKAAEETGNRYLLILARANSLYNQGEYSRAKYFYLKANELKPNEREPLDGIERVNEKLLSTNKEKSDSVEYNIYLDAGDSLANLNKFDSALVFYNKAKSIRPNNYYLNKQINYVQAEINRLKKEEDKIAEKKFNDAMAKAGIAVKEKRYEDALADYKEALSVHPDNKYAIDKARILTYQISIQKKTVDH